MRELKDLKESGRGRVCCEDRGEAERERILKSKEGTRAGGIGI